MPLLSWDPGNGIPVAAFCLPQCLSPLLCLLSSFFCTPFHAISFWVLGCYLSLVLFLCFHMLFCFFPSFSFFLLKDSQLKCSSRALSPTPPPSILPVLRTLGVTCMPKTPESLSEAPSPSGCTSGSQVMSCAVGSGRQCGCVVSDSGLLSALPLPK